MTERQFEWHSAFTVADLAAARSAIPQAIHTGQVRTSRAQTEYADPDGDQDVYGAGMARAVQKEFVSLVASLNTYHEQFVPGSRRKLTFIGDSLLFLHRVGKRMPRNHHRVRLNYLPDSRRELLHRTSNHKYGEPGLFEIAGEFADVATLGDALTVLTATNRTDTLFVPYYSSTAAGVGSIYWAPARLSGHYLEFANPERLVFERRPVSADGPGVRRAHPGFASIERPKTKVRLRRRPDSGTENK